MSYATLYGFGQDGEFGVFAEYKNAWHGAMLIWNSMAERYHTPFNLIDEKSMKALWNLADDPKVPIHDRITLATTFDRMVVYAGDFPRLVAALRESAKWMPAHCHITNQANDIEKIMELNDKCSNPDLHIIGVAWNATSVVDTWETGEIRMRKETDEKGRVDEYEESVPYNVNIHKRHHNLFEGMEG
jgi:hypothetical protein